MNIKKKNENILETLYRTLEHNIRLQPTASYYVERIEKEQVLELMREIKKLGLKSC